MWHQTVLLSETIEQLAIKPDGLYIDATCGGAGHSAAILAKLESKGRLLAFDRDREAREEASQRLAAKDYLGSYSIKAATFSSLVHSLDSADIGMVDGILADIGVSSHQFDAPQRGFSYLNDGPLDMRMDNSRGISASEVVNTFAESTLCDLFRKLGEEKFAASIAKHIVKIREDHPIETTSQLVDIIMSSVDSKYRKKQNPARKTFQALRMYVNDELGELAQLLESAVDICKDGGRIAVITFHSLEDRMVKQKFSYWENPCSCPKDLPYCVCGKKPIGRRVNRKPITPTAAEIAQNYRARSAKLRCFEFCQAPGERRKFI